MRMRNRLETRVARDGYRVCPKDRNGTFRALRPDGVALPKTPREASGRAARKGSKTRRGTFSITGAEAFGKPGIPNGQEMIWSGENPKRGRCRTRRGRAARKSAEPSYGKARRRLQKRGSAWRLREGTDRVGGARPAVKQRASNGCRPNDRFWACVVNRTHLGRIPCGKRSEDGALLSWTHDPDADSGSGTIREGSLAPKIPLGSLAPRRVPHSSGFGFPESKRRKGNRVRVLAVSMIASQRIRPRFGDGCVLAKLSIASIRKRGTRMASERFLGPKRYPSEAARHKTP